MTPRDRRLRNMAIIAFCCFCWAVVIGLVGGAWAAFEQPFPNIDSLAAAGEGGKTHD